MSVQLCVNTVNDGAVQPVAQRDWEAACGCGGAGWQQGGIEIAAGVQQASESDTIKHASTATGLHCTYTAAHVSNQASLLRRLPDHKQ
jgi:hypothetical protein